MENKKFNKLTKMQKNRLTQALHLAIDYQASLIDAHRTKLVNRGGKIISIFPSESQSSIRIWKQDIKYFQKLIILLEERCDI